MTFDGPLFVTLEPAVPGGVFTAAACGSAVLAFAFYAFVRRPGSLPLLAVRLSTAVLLAAVLAGVRVHRSAAAPPVVAVLLDASGSADETDGGERSRRETADALLDRLTPRLRRRARVEVRRFAERLGGPGDDADLGTGTHLASAVRAVTAADPRPAAVLVFTDGAASRPAERLGRVADLARDRGVPLFVVGLGEPRPAPPIGPPSLRTDTPLLRGEPVELTATWPVREPSAGAGRFTATAGVGEVPDAAARADVSAAGGVLTARFRLDPPPAGVHRVDVRLLRDGRPVDGAAGAATVEVRDATVRVLLMDGAARHEFDYLRTLLAREPWVELTASLQSAPPDAAGAAGFVTSPAAVERASAGAFDLLILGDLDPALLPARFPAAVAGLVRGGTGLALLPGRLADIVFPAPVPAPAVAAADRSRRREPRPTRLGVAENFFADTPAADTPAADTPGALPPVFGPLSAARPGPADLPLATATDADGGRSVAAVTRHGRGAVLRLFTDQTWRWRTPAGGPHRRFWTAAVRTLSGRGGGAELLPRTQSVTAGGDAELRLRGVPPIAAGGADLTLRVEGPGGPRAVPLDPAAGGVTLRVGGLPPGEHRASVPGTDVAPALITVSPRPPEPADPAPDFADLARAAGRGGGRFVAAADLNSPGLRNLAASLPLTSPRSERETVLRTDRSAAVLAALIASLAAGWVLSRRTS